MDMTKEFDSDFQVALLISDPEEAKNISDALRQKGIFAHFYRELDEMWVAINTQTPDFAIIDVTKMSQGSLLFQNHPKVTNGSLAFCFYYKEANQFLLNSTYHLNHYGYLKKELNLDGQMQTILRRRNEELRLINRNIEMEEKWNRSNNRIQKVMENAQRALNIDEHMKKINMWMEKIESAKNSEQVIYRILHTFADETEITKMAAFVLNRSGDKLASPHFVRTKYQAFPSLWLGQRSQEGLKTFAIDMAEQVALDFMGKSFQTIKISGHYNNPDILIFINYDRERWMDFPWEICEKYFSNAYRKSLINYADPELKGVHFKPIWDALNYLDDVHFHITSGEKKAINVNFSPLLNLIQQKHSNRFYWKDFYADFLSSVEDVLGASCEISMNGLSHMLVLVPNQEIEKAFDSIKNIIYNFQYYRYFEDPALVIARSTFPEIKMIAPSSVNYLRSIEKKMIEENELEMPNAKAITSTLGMKRNLTLGH
jgi:hypothetical protein